MGDFCHTQRGEVTRERRTEREAEASPFQRTRDFRDPDLGNGEEPCVGPCALWLGITQEGTPLVPCSSCHLLMPTRMRPTHGGRWKQMESAVGRENDVVFLLNMFKVFEN